MTMEVSVLEISKSIHVIRGRKILLDMDLAHLYNVKTKVLNQTVQRNRTNFPADFMFQLTQEEFNSLTFQSGRSKHQKHGGRRTLPFGFTQEGVAMLSGVLNTVPAIQININLMRAFVSLGQEKELNGTLENSIDLFTSRSFDKLNHHLKNIGHQLEQLVNIGLIQPQSSRKSTETRYATNDTIALVKTGSYSDHQDVEPLTTSKGLATYKISHTKVETIQRTVARFYELRVQDLKSSSRTHSIAHPRQIAMYLIRKQTGLGYREIGEFFGGKDHTTILHACQKIELLIKKDEQTRDAIKTILTLLE